MEEFDHIAMKAGAMLAEARTVGLGGSPYVVIPTDSTVRDLEYTLPAPLMHRKHPDFQTAGALVAYLNRFQTPGTIVFADEVGLKYVAVMDYANHGGEGEVANLPAWGHHTATFTPRKSKQYERWEAKNDKWMSQRDFGLFLEENAVDVTNPDAATMIEVSKFLRASRSVTFQSGEEIANGSVQFTYNEEVAGLTGRTGTKEVPREFEITIPIFWGGDFYKMRALFRYKIDNGALSMKYTINRLEFAVQAAFDDMTNVIGKAGSEIMAGKPTAS